MSEARIPRLLRSLGTCLVLGTGACDRAPPTGERPAVPADVPFAEVAAEVGLDFQHFIGATGEYFFPEMAGSGAALLDYDGDGDLDVYLIQGRLLDPAKSLEDSIFAPPSTHWPGNRLFRNELVPGGALRFTDVTDAAGVAGEGYGMGAAVGDYDNDGDPDLYVTNFGSNVLYRNEGDGTFTDVTREAGADDERWSTSASFVDFDRDGDLDLFVVNYVDFALTHNKVCQSAGGLRDYCGPTSYEPVPDRLFRNEGGGTFTDVTAKAGLLAAFGSGLGVVSADFNRDGWPDLYVANDGRANQLWLNLGDGTFRDAALLSGTAYDGAGVPEASMGATAGDVDNDGDEDIFLTHLNGETNTLYLNDGRGNFRDATDEFGLAHVSTPHTGFGTEWFDYDNDGDLDLFAANGAVKQEEDLRGAPYPFQQKNQLFRNEGDRRFADVSAQSGPALALFEVSRAAAFGDLDNDGDVDIVVTNSNGPARLLRNDIGNRNHWLLVALEGVESSRDGAGARVGLLRPGEPVLWRRAHTDGSYLSANDPRVHFGLGSNSAVERVTVHWPRGRREVWRDIRADALVRLREGTGAPAPE